MASRTHRQKIRYYKGQIQVHLDMAIADLQALAVIGNHESDDLDEALIALTRLYIQTQETTKNILDFI